MKDKRRKGKRSTRLRQATAWQALNSERIETRSLPALTHVLPPISTSRFCPSMSLASPRLRSLAPTLVTLPSMSLIPFAPFRISAFLSAVGLAKEDQRLPSQLLNAFRNLKCLGRGDVLRPLDLTPISD